jgi:hypothetical protein
LKRFVNGRKRRSHAIKPEIRFHSLSGSAPKPLPKSRIRDQTVKRVDEPLFIAGRDYQTGFTDDAACVTNIGRDDGKAAAHGLGNHV